MTRWKGYRKLKNLNNIAALTIFTVILMVAGGGLHKAYAASESQQGALVDTPNDPRIFNEFPQDLTGKDSLRRICQGEVISGFEP